MPSKSKSMQRTMGWALACKTGKTDNCPKNIQKIADGMPEDKLKEFAKTKHKGLPERKKKKKVNESYVLTFEQFLIKENAQVQGANFVIARKMWDELTITNKPYFDKHHQELLDNLDAMDDGERCDHYDNFLFCLYQINPTFGYEDDEIGNYQRSMRFTFDETNIKDDAGKGIWDYIPEIIEDFLKSNGLL